MNTESKCAIFKGTDSIVPKKCGKIWVCGWEPKQQSIGNGTNVVIQVKGEIFSKFFRDGMSIKKKRERNDHKLTSRVHPYILS